MSDLIPIDYPDLLNDIKDRIRSAQYEALKAVNKQLISLYWEIGRLIVERQQGETWGKSVVETLAKDLQSEFTGIKGFSSANIWRMRQFHLTYRDNEKLAPMVREIGWTHNIVIFTKCKDLLQREFYIRMTRKFGWTKNVLIHHIENQSYEKTLLNQTNFDQAITEELRNQAKLAVKDEYTFDFLELGDDHIFGPEQAHELPKRIEFMLWTTPLSQKRIQQALPNEKQRAISDALSLLLKEGRIAEVKGRTVVYKLIQTADRQVRPGWMSRIGSLNSLMGNLADTVFLRFFDSDPQMGERAFARTLNLRIPRNKIRKLQELYEESIWSPLKELDSDADESAIPLKISILWAPYEHLLEGSKEESS